MVYGFAGSASGPATIDPDSTVHSLRVVHDPSFIVGFVLWFDLAHHNHDLHGEACAYRPTSAESAGSSMTALLSAVMPCSNLGYRRVRSVNSP